MKYMQRILLVLLMLALLAGCSPQTPVTPDPDKPITEQPGGEETPETPVTTVQNPLLDEKAKRNEALLPRGIDKNHEWVKAAAGNTFTVYYPAENDAFSYKNGKNTVGETSWLRRMGEEYDITLRAVRKSPEQSLSAIRLAQLSGMSLDLLAFTPDQLPFASSLTANASELLEKQETPLHFLNTRLCDNRFFTPAGVARNLWYLTDSKAGTDPLALSAEQLWDLAAFSNYVAGHTRIKDGTVSVYGVEIQDFTDMLHSLGTPLISFEKRFNDNAAKAVDNMDALRTLCSVTGRYYNGKTRAASAPCLANKTLSMRYGQTPFTGIHDKYPAFRWAPLPTAEKNSGEGMLAACAPILALPKKGTKNEITLGVALLWAARYADANHDMLRFDYGMTYEDWQSYFEATNRLIETTYPDGLSESLAALVTAPRAEGLTALKDSTAAAVKALNERLSDHA